MRSGTKTLSTVYPAPLDFGPGLPFTPQRARDLMHNAGAEDDWIIAAPRPCRRPEPLSFIRAP